MTTLFFILLYLGIAGLFVTIDLAYCTLKARTWSPLVGVLGALIWPITTPLVIGFLYVQNYHLHAPEKEA